MIVIGLNPSTADESDDDPTIRRCIGFAKREGCGKLVMLNLFAFRATKPADLRAALDAIGPRTDFVLRRYADDRRNRIVIAAWGRHGTPQRAARVMSMFATVHCLGRNADGSPKHPLYLRADTRLTRYRPKNKSAAGGGAGRFDA